MPRIPNHLAKTDTPYVCAYRCLERRGPGWVEEAGWVNGSRGIPQERTLDAWQISHVSRGNGWFRDGTGTTSRIVAGSWYSLFPGVPHAYAPDPGTTWDECFVIFGGPVARLLERHGTLQRGNPVRRAEPIAYWQARLAAVFSTDGNEPAASAAFRMAATATDLSAVDMRSGSWLAGAKRALDPLPDSREASVTSVARAHGLSDEAFRKRFTRLAGIAPRRWRERRRIERACELLLDRHRPLSEISATCGFADAAHFSRRFSAVLGASPRQWQRRLPL